LTSRRKESLYLEITSEEVHDDGIMLNKLVNNALSSSARAAGGIHVKG
jgi:hypothetical protein